MVPKISIRLGRMANIKIINFEEINPRFWVPTLLQKYFFLSFVSIILLPCNKTHQVVNLSVHILRNLALFSLLIFSNESSPYFLCSYFLMKAHPIFFVHQLLGLVHFFLLQLKDNLEEISHCDHNLKISEVIFYLRLHILTVTMWDKPTNAFLIVHLPTETNPLWLDCWKQCGGSAIVWAWGPALVL